MAFDGLLIHQLCDEMSPLLVGGRIDKIFQPEKDELTIGIRGHKDNLSLFISVDASMPYFTLIHDKKENPQTPPMFCMLLRKHLVGGRIHAINQLGYERVVIIDIESKNDFGEPENKKLIIEIMGKHSNLILTRENFTIIDSIKRVTPEMSRVRSVLPGLVYSTIPTDKIDFNETNDVIIQSLTENHGSKPLHKVFHESIQGFSPSVSKWISRQLNIDPAELFSNLANQDLLRLSACFEQLKNPDTSGGTVFFDGAKKPKDFHFIKDLITLFESVNYDRLCDAIEQFHTQSNRTHKMHQRTQALKKNLAQRVERYVSKLAKQELELHDAENADHWKIIGELILANIYQISKGMNRVEVTDYYQDPPVMRTIELDTRLEPSENAQLHFKRYNKLKKALIELKQQIDETQKDVLYLENVLTLLNNSEDSKTVDEIREELVQQGYLKGKVAKQKQKQKSTKPNFKTYYSTDGMEILVGKSSLQNDYLSTKLASNKDVWLHTKDIPGSHVIVRTAGETPTEKTLNEAAHIAAYYSKAKDSSNVPVDYTFVKNVSKPSGAKPGMVIYVNNKTLFVTPDSALLKSLETRAQK